MYGRSAVGCSALMAAVLFMEAVVRRFGGRSSCLWRESSVIFGTRAAVYGGGADRGGAGRLFALCAEPQNSGLAQVYSELLKESEGPLCSSPFFFLLFFSIFLLSFFPLFSSTPFSFSFFTCLSFVSRSRGAGVLRQSTEVPGSELSPTLPLSTCGPWLHVSQPIRLRVGYAKSGTEIGGTAYLPMCGLRKVRC